MLTSVRMVNFKNFADETLKVGPFTVIVGANASGKSNIRDAFRFLHGIGRGYTLAEILGGKYGPGGQREWDGIRGAPLEIERIKADSPTLFSEFSIHTEMDLAEEKALYSIMLGSDLPSFSGFSVLREALRTDSGLVFTAKLSDDSRIQALVGEDREELDQFSATQPVLARIFPPPDIGLMPRKIEPLAPEYAKNVIVTFQVEAVLSRMRFLEPSPSRMREPSLPGSTLGDSGENLPSVLESICAAPQRGQNLMSWLQELTPMDVKDFDFPRDPSGRVHLHIVERNGRKVSAYSASDGTLRFLGMLAALLIPNQGGLYFFEEIDNGIHPSRLWLLLDFIEQQTAKGDVQVITTTHSPALLAWMSDTAFENASVVYRDEYWSDSVIRPIAGLYNLRELRKSVTLGELQTEGWLEHAMKVSEGDPSTAHLPDDDEDDWVQGAL